MIEVNSFINGSLTLSAGTGVMELSNPATGKMSTVMPAGCGEDVEQAVTAGRAAFEDGRWTNMPSSQRRTILHEFANLIEKHAGELDTLDALDMGKPLSIDLGNAAGGAHLLRYYANAMDNVTGDVCHSDKSALVAQQRMPRGVVGAIVPWNFPAMAAATKFAPALAAGNSVVLKPSECSPRSALRIAQLATEAGLPPGVLNVVQGRGDIAGKALALHNDVDMIAFTGSTAVGKLMLQYAGQSNLKLVHAECGGKSPQIVFADYADLDSVADNVAGLILLNQGQLCVTGSRLLVQKDIEGILIEKIVERFKQVVPGDPLHPETSFGPLVNQAQMEKVLAYIETGERQAELVCGGGRILEESGGYFVAPTLFRNVAPDAVIAREEIFGPVLSVTGFGDVDEAIRLANSTPYGLAAYAWTTDLNTGMKLSKAIRSSTVTVNAVAPVSEEPLSMSIEPYGLSGVGVEHGMAGLEAYLRRQVTWFNHA